MTQGKVEETEKRCIKCGQKVWLDDGFYGCECYSVEVWYIRDGMIDWPDFWVDEDAAGGEYGNS